MLPEEINQTLGAQRMWRTLQRAGVGFSPRHQKMRAAVGDDGGRRKEGASAEGILTGYYLVVTATDGEGVEILPAKSKASTT